MAHRDALAWDPYSVIDHFIKMLSASYKMSLGKM